MIYNTAFILAGGKGTRLKELTEIVPKPMVEINKVPLLIYIVNYYKYFGVKNIYILSGFKHEYINNYFDNNFKKSNGSYLIGEECNLTILYTGKNSLTGLRLSRGLKNVSDSNFYLTYGDGLSNVNLHLLTKRHYKSNCIGTVTAVRPPARFGSLELKYNSVLNFGEKKYSNNGWINGGYFAFNRSILDYLKNKNISLEGEPMEKLASDKKLNAYKHKDFWQCVDTIREKEILEESIDNNLFTPYE